MVANLREGSRSFSKAAGVQALAPGTFDPDQRLQPGAATDAFGVAVQGLGAPEVSSYNPQAGIWHIMPDGYNSYSGATLEAGS